MPVARERPDPEFVAPLRELRLHAGTELYLGVLHPGESGEETRERIARAREHVTDFGVATPCGWGRMPPRQVPELVAVHAAHSRPVADPRRQRDYVFAWPDGFERILPEDWVEQEVDAFGLHYDTVENHGWYSNLDLTVDQLAQDLEDGDVLIDYSGGPGILLDRLR